MQCEFDTGKRLMSSVVIERVCRNSTKTDPSSILICMVSFSEFVVKQQMYKWGHFEIVSRIDGENIRNATELWALGLKFFFANG